MNDYLIHRLRDVPRVAFEGMRLRHGWPEVEGAVGLWFVPLRAGRRQVSISIWRDPSDISRFVRSPKHLRVMREYRDTGVLYTSTWIAERFDRDLILQQAGDRLHGRVEGVPHHS
jgi:hypothetical protein